MAPVDSSLRITNPSALARRLLAWFATVRRDLPWRDGGDLYGIWVSEIMLQQTTVQAVIPYWDRFMDRFPTVADLAAAEADEVLRHWSGLGYYTRARNLHAAARAICAEGGGRLPRTREQWGALPGVGPYASGAIASIGLGERVPAMDANARRVIARWAVTDPEAWAASSPTSRQRAVDALGATLVPSDDPGTWNEAVMELGALVCNARRPACGGCPVADLCRAGSGAWADLVPPPRAAGRPTPVWVGLLLVHWRGRVMLMPSGSAPLPCPAGDRPVARSDFGGLHRGLWALPMTPWLAGAAAPALPAEAWLRWLDLPSELLGPAPVIRWSGGFGHGITRYRLAVAVGEIELDAHGEMPRERLAEAGATSDRGVFYGPGDVRPPLSRLTEKALHFQGDSAV